MPSSIESKRMYKVRYRAGSAEDTVMVLAGNHEEAESLVIDDHPNATILDVRKVHQQKI